MAAVHDFQVDQGSFKRKTFKIQRLTDPTLPFDQSNPFINIDIASYEFRMQVRNSYDNNSAVLTFSSVGTNPAITKHLVTSEIYIDFLPTVTSAIKFSGDEIAYVYDLECYTPGNENSAVRLVQGEMVLSREATRIRN